MIAEWDPYTTPIITEMAGTVKYGDIIEGKTMEERVDERTGARSNVIVEFKELDVRPRISIKDESGKTAKIESSDNFARYYLPVGAYIAVAEGTHVDAGEIIAKIPRETTKTKDITGGLPRVAELFEARKPKEFAVISEIDGQVSFGKDTKGKRKVVVTPEVGETREYLIAKGKHIGVHEGDMIKAGEPLMEGSSNPHDILTILGEKALAKYLVDEIQEIYRLPGRADQRQAYRGDCPADAAASADQGSRRHRFPGRRSDRKMAFRRRERPRVDEGGRARDSGAVAARDHQGVAVDRELYLGGLVPGDHAGADRSGDQRQGRPADRA